MIAPGAKGEKGEVVNGYKLVLKSVFIVGSIAVY